MPTVRDNILKAFEAKLVTSGSIDQPTIDAIRAALATGNKLKADDFVAIIAKEQAGGTP